MPILTSLVSCFIVRFLIKDLARDFPCGSGMNVLCLISMEGM